MINILVLMAGNSDHFQKAGFSYPKNLIEIHGKPLIQHTLQALTDQHAGLPKSKIICLIQQEEIKRYHTASVVGLINNHTIVMPVASNTKGAACTALLAIEHINNDQPLLITNGDIILEANLPTIIHDFQTRNLDAGTIVFESIHPRWSYVRCDEQDYVIEASEKRPISHLATAGCYYFKQGRDFVNAAMGMIRKDAQVEGAFYICPVFNELILQQKRIGIHKIKNQDYISLALPEGVRNYEALLTTRINHA